MHGLVNKFICKFASSLTNCQPVKVELDDFHIQIRDTGFAFRKFHILLLGAIVIVCAHGLS